MNNVRVCPIWGTKTSSEIPVTRDGRTVDSRRAGGMYFVSRRAEASLEKLSKRFKARLTSWLVDKRRLGEECPEITDETIERTRHRKDLRVGERADRLLQYMDRETSEIGELFSFRITSEMYSNSDMTLTLDEINYMEMLAVSESVKWPELEYLLEHLKSKGFVVRSGQNNRDQECLVTPDGYSRLADLEQVHTDSSKAFVAMWFHESMEDVWLQGIAPAIKEAGYEAVRIDKKEHVNKIDDEIIAEIRRSRFVVADFTHGEAGVRGGVYYEAGFAHGLDIPVIFSCRKSALADVHLDTRQYNHIVWETPDELRESLRNRIAAVIGDGPYRKGAVEDLEQGKTR